MIDTEGRRHRRERGLAGDSVAAPDREREGDCLMRRVARRFVLLCAVALVSAGAGSALLASPAFAGGVDTNGLYTAGVYNLTPYPWTLVAQGAPALTGNNNCTPNPTCWNTFPAQTIAPGTSMVYGLTPNDDETGFLGIGRKFGFDGFMTYRVDVLDGAPEYVTIALTQCACSGTFGNSIPALRQFITTAPPPPNYDPANNPDAAPAPVTANPQLTYQVFVPQQWDLTYTVTGNYTVDASTDLGAPFVDLLSAVCGSDPTKCSFTQVGPLTWGVGAAVLVQRAENCVVGAGGQRSSPSPAPGAAGEAPPPTDPSWVEVEWTAARTASLSVGAGLTGSVEENLFDIVSAKISVSIEAETEWTNEQSFTRKSKMFIPANNIARMWVAPVVGSVTGTLVLSLGSATFTAVNFTEERSGVSKDALTPAFNVITKTRPMTAAEFADECQGKSSPSGLLGGGRTLGWPKGKAPVRLTPGQGVAGVKLGETQAQVVQQLGEPRVKTFFLNPCRSVGPGCDAVAGRGGTWSYPRLSVVFGPDWRVSGLSYGGARLSAKAVGVGSTLLAVRAAYPRASCTRQGKQRLCTLPGVYAGRTVRTVFRFRATRAGRYECDGVQIYVFVPSAKSVSA
jgi:hypothetical protein